MSYRPIVGELDVASGQEYCVGDEPSRYWMPTANLSIGASANSLLRNFDASSTGEPLLDGATVPISIASPRSLGDRTKTIEEVGRFN